MSFSNQEVSNKLAEVIRNGTLTIFQRGFTNQTGIGATISVDTPLGRVQAYSYNVIQSGEVTVFYDTTNQRYVAWQQTLDKPPVDQASGSGGGNSGRLIHRTELQFRKTRPGGVKPENYNFIVAQDDGLLEGFGKDVDLSTDELNLTTFLRAGCCGYDGVKIGLFRTLGGRYVVYSDNTLITDVTPTIPMDHVGYINYYGTTSITNIVDNVRTNIIMSPQPLSGIGIPIQLGIVRVLDSTSTTTTEHKYSYTNPDLIENTNTVISVSDSYTNITFIPESSPIRGRNYPKYSATLSAYSSFSQSSSPFIHPFTDSKHAIFYSGTGSYSASGSESHESINNDYYPFAFNIPIIEISFILEGEYSQSGSSVEKNVVLFATGANCSIYMFRHLTQSYTSSGTNSINRGAIYDGVIREFDDYTHYARYDDSTSVNNLNQVDYENNILVMRINGVLYEIDKLAGSICDVREHTVYICDSESYTGLAGSYTFTNYATVIPIFGKETTVNGVPEDEDDDSVIRTETTRLNANIGLQADVYMLKPSDSIYTINSGVITAITKENDDVTSLSVSFAQNATSTYVHIDPLLSKYSGNVVITAKNDKTAFIAALYQASTEQNYVNQSNLYPVVIDEDNTTIEIAFSKRPTDTVEQKKHTADIYRFDTLSLKWIRKPNGRAILSTLTDTSEYISYHPRAISKITKRL